MRLELREAELFLRSTLRPLVREAKQEGFHLHALASGFQENTLYLGMNHAGPWLDRGWIKVRLAAHSENHFFSYDLRLNKDEKVDTSSLVSHLKTQLGKYATLSEPCKPAHLSLKVRPPEVCEKLLSLTPAEQADFFRSRFLRGRENQVIYSGQVTMGLAFQAYVSGLSSSFQFSGGSYFRVVHSIRSEQFTLSSDLAGRTLREMHLSKVRSVSDPFIQAQGPLEHHDLGSKVVLGFQALVKLARTLLEQDQNLFNGVKGWLEPCPAEESTRLHLLPDTPPWGEIDETLAHLRPFFCAWKQEAGELELDLSDLAEGRLPEGDEVVYIQDLAHVELKDAVVHATSYNTSLYIDRGRKPRYLDQSLSFSFRQEQLFPEHIRACARLKTWANDRLTLLLPEYAVLTTTELKASTEA